MQQYHNNPFSWLLIKRLTAILIFLLFFSCFTAKAQYNNNSDSRYGVSIGTDYDAPVGNFAYTFKPTLNYNLNLYHHVGNFTSYLGFGYHIYKPKQDTFYYQLSDTEYGRISYQNFSVYSFYLGGTYDYPVNDQLKIYGGINLGVYYTHFAFQSSDFLEQANEDLHEEDLYFAPRLGFTYKISDNIGLGLEGKYNFFAPTGERKDNDRVGTLYNSYSVGIRLSYDF